MKERLYNTYRKYGIVVLGCACMAFLISVSTSSYLNNSLSVRNQSASVLLAQSSYCFSSTEMNQIQSSKQNAEASLTSENEKLSLVESDIDKAAKEYNAYTEEFDALKVALISEPYLNEIKKDIDTTQKRLFRGLKLTVLKSNNARKEQHITKYT